ncbi:3-hydroxyanthranilate 3,4-dioxygenase [Exaiptasia diaphana]|uniref:3-hydroxyanthranilate 3,4-dioxygenase n=1 Tax=Exaiptasia diaphana TaxID=2652724 RepID=A0A913WP72_EXADI|nr:3-hydroxyanthranilate 3,4-dioxygenase [Exaiptasia diaphana]KXJ19133.1 3-hydroxyanthranilate 3,4-dioxygenase [Exaiptasia diaphana]
MPKREGEAETIESQESKKQTVEFKKPIDMMDWIETSKDSFKPPVCNKLMYGAGQLKVMFVGGPNVRKDYHIEEGEELFYQVKGDMVLKVLEKGVPKDIPIKEGEMFLLPSRIHHSPQRFENTIGLVIERERLKDEFDGLRYFCEDGVTVLWEKWFHCVDLGTQLGPVIKEYFASEPHKTGVPDPDNIWKKPPLEVDTETELKAPFSLKEWLKNNKKENGKKAISTEGELKIHVHEEGEEKAYSEGETWFWQMEGEASLTVGEATRQLKKNDVALIPAGSNYKIKINAESVGLSVIMDPLANKD